MGTDNNVTPHTLPLKAAPSVQLRPQSFDAPGFSYITRGMRSSICLVRFHHTSQMWLIVFLSSRQYNWVCCEVECFIHKRDFLNNPDIYYDIMVEHY